MINRFSVPPLFQSTQKLAKIASGNLDPELVKYYSEESAFDQLMNCEGEKFRHIKTRRTIKFECGGKNYFIKIHRACGWREVWKNWFAFI